MSRLAKLDFIPVMAVVRVTTSARRLSYLVLKLVTAAWELRPELLTDVAVHQTDSATHAVCGLLIAVIRNGHMCLDRTPTAQLMSALSWWVS